MARNWAGTYEYTAPRIVEARSIVEVRRALAGAERVRALGTRHSFTDLPDTTGTLVDVTGFAPDFELDAAARTVTVPAGIRYGVLATWLDERGWALGNMGSLPHINVGGAAATGTHGSGDRNRVLSASVASFRYVGADGELREVRRGDDDFDALVVGLGAYGIVVSLTVDIVPSYRVRQDVYTGVSWDAALGDLDAVTGAGYSVSVFTRWEPGVVGFVWVKSRVEDGAGVVPEALLDGTLDVDAEPLGGLADVTEMRGVAGPWMLRLPHFRLDGAPSFGDEIQSEYFVSRGDAAPALRAVRDLGDLIRRVLFVSELRTVAADELWLSPAYARDVVASHFTWHNRPDEVAIAVARVEAALAPYGARPHWGKQHGFDRRAMQRVHPRLADARGVFERLDPGGRFTNAHLERVGVRGTR
jgi:xylitol oxidase